MTNRLAALLTCHNRKEQTLACLRSLASQRVEGAQVETILVDAASVDGTPEVVASEFPDVTLLQVSSDHFWNGGMWVAFNHAVASSFDAYLWLNDDTLLDGGAVCTLLKAYASVEVQTGRPGIIVGSTRDPVTGEFTYGGVVRRDWKRPLRFELLAPTSVPRECHTMNGNCVLIPHNVVERIGVLDPRFTHGMGDFDYGLRARRAGFKVWISPGAVGTCARNVSVPKWDLRVDVRALTGPKGLPPAEWLTFARRWAGPLWPVYALSPYARWLARRVTS